MAAALNRRLREGVAAAQAGEYDRARPLLESVIAEAPNEPLAWFWLAVAAVSATDAIRCLRRVLAADATHDPAREALGKLLASQAATTFISDRAGALEAAREASALAPGITAVWLALAAVTDGDDRVDALRRAVAIDGDDPQLRTRLRQALLYRGYSLATHDREHARRLFRDAAEIDPRDARVWRALTNLADTPADAAAALRELLSLTPDDTAVRTQLKGALASDARELGASGASPAAVARWREVLELDHLDIEAWLGLADTTEDEAESDRALDRAEEIAPDDERVAAAIARMRPALDPSAVPAGAFERLAAPGAALDTLAADDSLFAQFDLAPAAAAAAPVAIVRAELEPAPIVTLPAASASPAPVVMETAADPLPEEPGDDRRTVMVVDDSPTIRKILGLTLERAGYKVVAEADGESAVERLTHLVPDLILLDIAMPKLDGYEVCRRIKQDPRTARVPVVMLSGKDAFFDKVKGKMAGATEYLTKPFETPAVLAVVSEQCLAAEEVAHG